jgi:hypothetical protein
MILFNLLNGKTKLWKAWWLFWQLPIGIILLINLKIGYAAQDFQFNNGLFLLLYFCIAIADGFFRILAPFAIWKCSHNCKSKGWSSIARILIVLYPIFAVMQIFGNTGQAELNRINKLSLLSLNAAMFVAISIIVIYLMGKFFKSKKILSFTHKYFAPIFILLSNMFLCIGIRGITFFIATIFIIATVFGISFITKSVTIKENNIITKKLNLKFCAVIAFCGMLYLSILGAIIGWLFVNQQKTTEILQIIQPLEVLVMSFLIGALSIKKQLPLFKTAIISILIMFTITDGISLLFVKQQNWIHTIADELLGYVFYILIIIIGVSISMLFKKSLLKYDEVTQ